MILSAIFFLINVGCQEFFYSHFNNMEEVANYESMMNLKIHYLICVGRSRVYRCTYSLICVGSSRGYRCTNSSICVGNSHTNNWKLDGRPYIGCIDA